MVRNNPSECRRLGLLALAAIFLIGSSVLAACSSPSSLAESIGAGANAADTTQAVSAATGNNSLHDVLKVLVAHSPKKQVAVDNGMANPAIGRTPGSACEVIRFLTKYVKIYGADNTAENKLRELADWVVGLQSAERGRPRYGGVPSTPDLPAPSNTYYYAIDAALCGDAMYRAHEVTGREQYLKSAVAFSDFLVTMHTGPGKQSESTKETGFCEYVVDDGVNKAWNCRRYVKVLLALPTLRKAASVTKRQHYDVVARSSRKFLVAGLAGAWEYAEECGSRACTPTWRRVQGPQKQPDFFVYGDTLAYALRGLFEFEGLTQDVRSLYDRYAGFAGKDQKTRAYDGRIAFAGYIHPASKSPDEFSAYYDLVTLGILHELRRAHRKDHFEAAEKALTKIVASASKLSWKMNFDLSVPASDYVDLTTLANLGEALLVAR